MIRLTHLFIIISCCVGIPGFAQSRTDSIADADSTRALPQMSARELAGNDSLLSTGRMLNQLEAVVNPNNRVLLRWDATFSSGSDSSYSTIERSLNGVNFDIISIIRNQRRSGNAEFMDEMPARGTNYYRLRFSSAGKTDRFSPVVEANVSSGIAVKFYPNPVDKLLIIRSEKPVELQLSDAAGKLWINKSLPAGIQLVDVSALDKGLYVITLTQKDAGKSFSEKLIKN